MSPHFTELCSWRGASALLPPLRAKDLARFQEVASDRCPAGIVIDEMYRDQVSTLRSHLESANLAPIVVYADHVRTDETTH